MAALTKAKPKCETGTACGDTCISKQDNCSAAIAKSVAQGLLGAVRSAVKDAANNKVFTAANLAATAASFAFPADLAADGDAVISAVDSALAYSLHQVVIQLRKRKSLQAA